jgi:g-D-glutamyl-meso-diaminopimelate peptidase
MMLAKKAILLLLLLMHLNPSLFHAEIVNGKEWYTYENMVEDLKALKRQYGSDLDIESIGSTEFGKEIWAVKVGKGNESIIILAGHHGREWLTCSLVMTMLEQYVHAYADEQHRYGYNTSILDDVAIWFVPMVNPDGIRVQQEGVHFLPKHLQEKLIRMNGDSRNFERWKANGQGLDLNRQYPAGWNAIKESIRVPYYQFFKGDFPLQAKETRAVVDFTRSITPLMAVTYHSSGRVLYWNFTSDQAILKRDLTVAKKLSNITGYKLDYPEDHAVGGGFSDWFVSEFKRPSFTPEISYPVEETNPPLSVFREEWQRNKRVGLFLATESKKMFLSGNDSERFEEE